MNIDKCRRRKMGHLKCVFIKKEDDVCTECLVNLKDHYNVFPEHNNSNRTTIHQVGGKNDIIQLGPNLIWENVSSGTLNDHGLSWFMETTQTDPKTGKTKYKRRFEADLHPNYTILEREIPLSSGKIKDDSICEIMGMNNPVLVSTDWTSTKIKGNKNIDICWKGIYGTYKEEKGLVIPKCMQNHTNIVKGWKNYTKLDENDNKPIYYLPEMSDEEIALLCINWFSKYNDNILKRIVKMLIHARGFKTTDWKNGKNRKPNSYFNIYWALRNFGISHKIASEFYGKISLNTINTIYSGSMNIENMLMLYDCLSFMKKDHKYINDNGETVVDKIDLSVKEIVEYRCNILNWILNWPEWKEIENYDKRYIEEKSIDNDEIIYRKIKRKPKHRYWYIKNLLKRAVIDHYNPYTGEIIHGPIIDKEKMSIPSYLADLIKISDKHDRTVKLFNNDYDELDNKVIDDTYDTIYSGLNEPQQLYPAMEKIENIIDEWDENEEIYQIFASILRAGIKWTKNEIKATWKIFKDSYNNPKKFWKWIKNINEAQWNDDFQNNKCVNELMPDDDIYPSWNRSFSENLLDNHGYSIGNDDSFDVSDPINIQEEGMLGKIHASGEDQWMMLAMIGGLRGNKFQLDEIINEENRDINSDEYSISKNDLLNNIAGKNNIISGDITTDDINNISTLNLYSGKSTEYGRTESWQEEE